MKKLAGVLILIVLISCKQKSKKIKLFGPVFGTSFNIQYYTEDNTNYQKQFDSLFTVVNKSMSTYIPDSKISKINKGETVEVDEHFIRVFETAKRIYRETEGAFDPTIGAVVNAWDFGPEGRITKIDSTAIDSLMKTVGYNRMGLVDRKIVKSSNSFLDFNAIAKGYGVDVIGEFLESKEIKDYLVEIGGELRVRGINLEKKSSWKAGVQRPRFDGVSDPNDYVIAVSLENESMATSGSYRKFKIDENGNRYAHIINTKTGYPSKTNILSVSVLATDCMTADGYATAFQAMGIEAVTEFLYKHPELKVYFIYEDDSNELKTLNLNDFPE